MAVILLQDKAIFSIKYLDLHYVVTGSKNVIMTTLNIIKDII